MKKLILSLVLLLAINLAYSQETIVDKNLETQGSAALLLEGTTFADKFIPSIGLRGGWTINKKVFTGFDLNLLVPTVTLDNVASDPVMPTGIFGGLVVEPIIAGNDLVHFTIPITMGGGGIFYFLDWSVDEELNAENDDLRDGTFFGYIEPGVSLEVNVFERLRLGLGVGYRLTTKLDLDNTASDAFQGMNYQIILKFGKY
mgnify:CR=1 FL=1